MGRAFALMVPTTRRPEMSWTDERVETLKSMWADGKSASQIAKELGGVTRNAVIGKVHRLGLSNRVGGPDRPEDELQPADAAADEPGPDPEADAQKPGAAPSAPQPPARPFGKDVGAPRSKPGGQPLPPQPSPSEISAEALANLAEVAKKSRRLSLMQLTERTCKWPIGDPATDDFWFCGLPSVPGKPYCETHVAVAFQPMSARRDRRAGGR
jgi:GcrA cell cycle regulator